MAKARDNKTGKIRAVCVLAGGLVALTASEASASGLSAARFGGEHGHPTTDNPTAIYYNPAGIALSKGTHIFVDGTLALRYASYDRPQGESSTPDQELRFPGANDGRGTLFNTLLAPFAGITSDFGTDFIYAGVGVYFPFGGSAVWDKNVDYKNSDLAPGAYDGQSRWYSIDGTIRSLYVTGALAFNIRKIGLSIGFSGSAIRSEADSVRARNADATDDIINDLPEPMDDSIKEGRSWLEASGWQGGFAVGLVYDVARKGKYFIGASYTSQPNVTGGMSLEGTLSNTFGIAVPDRSNVEVTQTFPDIVRLGIRIKPTEKYEIRLFGDYTRWSVFDRQCVLSLDAPDRNCDFPGTNGDPLGNPENYGAKAPDDETAATVIQHLPRFWKDAGGVRLGASYWFAPPIEAFIGVGYDSTAVPLETLDPTVIDGHKMTTSLGFRWQVKKYFGLGFTSTEVFMFRTSTKGKSVLHKFNPPTRQPSGNGVYTTFFQLFDVFMDFSF